MSEAVKIAIVVEGGIVQQVLSAGVPVEYTIVDYDTEGAEGPLYPILQDNNTFERAILSKDMATIDGPFVVAVDAMAE